MDTETVALVAALFFLVSILYSSVGHGGASGYIVVMGLIGLPTDMIRPVALALNIVVAGLGAIRFARAGHFDWKAALPFVATSIPLAFLGGTIVLPTNIYRPLLGMLLLISAAHLVWRSIGNVSSFDMDSPRVPTVGGLSAGGLIGFVSGLSGIGGGVILSPLVIIMRWASLQQTSAIAAFFIAVNSSAGLLGNLISVQQVPTVLPIWIGAVLVGAWIGSGLGAWRLSPRYLIWLLAVALLIAGTKFLLF